MMRRDQQEGSQIGIDIPMTPSTKRRNDVMKRFNDVWKTTKNGLPGSPPRSPISKAFDFLPWSRSKRNSEKSTNDKKGEIQHKNIFRNGAIIRDVLTDKSNKNRPTNNDMLQQQHQDTSSGHKKGRRLSRNKSLDIDELIRKAETKDDDDSEENNVKTFYDDTYIESMMKNDTGQKDLNENIPPRNLNNSQKHILFNDENVVYLIKKEKPVRRNNENSKEKSRGSIRQKNVEVNNNTIFTEGSVIKARLKLKKVPSQDDSIIQQPPPPSKRGILYRYNSMDSQLPSDSVGSKSSEAILEHDACGNGDCSDKSKLCKPRKKLSFRDPVVLQRQNDLQTIRPTNPAANQNKITDNPKELRINCGRPYDCDLESQAMHIVRTVGQAFEVCHKLNLQKNSLENNDERSDVSSSEMLDQDRISEQLSDDDLPKKEFIPVTPDLNLQQRPNHLEIIPQTNRKSPCNDGDKSPGSPVSSAKEIQQLKEQLEQQALQTRQALAQLMLVREQLISETNARIEAQARTQQLLQQNRELLEHLASIGGYTEPNQSGLTSANIALAPQSPLQMLFHDQSDLPSPMRKAFLTTSNNNNLAAINQQLNNLGSINQQLSTLSHQLNGLNQQSQNLQNFQNLGSLPIQTPNAFPSLSQIQAISNKLSNLSQHPTADVFTQKELFQMNQELLNRLQNLNLGLSVGSNTANGQSLNNNNSPHNSFFFTNPGNMSSSPSSNGNNNFNFLNSPSSLGNLTPSPMGTLNRPSYTNSLLDDDLGISIDKNLNSLEDAHFIKPLSQVGTLTTLDADGKVKVIVPVSNGEGSRQDPCSSPNKRSSNDRKLTVPNTVTLKITDESGNVTNSRKLSATPSFITRSTSEKVPNRSQMMSQVQRTAWARHTTK